MELSWTTFILEIINFLVLVWILKRFLYKPVLNVIARRHESIAQRLAEADARYADAKKLQETNTRSLAELESERQQAHEALARELEAERSRRMAELHATIEQEREKARVAETRRNADDKRKMEISALRQACRFASRLLAEASGPDTQFRLVELLIEELSKLTPQRVEELRANYGHPPDVIVVVSAFPLAEDQRRQLEQTLTGITTADTAVRFEQNIELLAGVRITIGAWVLAASVLDELQGFMELAQDE